MPLTLVPICVAPMNSATLFRSPTPGVPVSSSVQCTVYSPLGSDTDAIVAPAPGATTVPWFCRSLLPEPSVRDQPRKRTGPPTRLLPFRAWLAVTGRMRAPRGARMLSLVLEFGDDKRHLDCGATVRHRIGGRDVESLAVVGLEHRNVRHLVVFGHLDEVVGQGNGARETRSAHTQVAGRDSLHSEQRDCRGTGVPEHRVALVGV